jgi:hypothetical protein
MQQATLRSLISTALFNAASNTKVTHQHGLIQCSKQHHALAVQELEGGYLACAHHLQARRMLATNHQMAINLMVLVSGLCTSPESTPHAWQ